MLRIYLTILVVSKRQTLCRISIGHLLCASLLRISIAHLYWAPLLDIFCHLSISWLSVPNTPIIRKPIHFFYSFNSALELEVLKSFTCCGLPTCTITTVICSLRLILSGSPLSLSLFRAGWNKYQLIARVDKVVAFLTRVLGFVATKCSKSLSEVNSSYHVKLSQNIFQNTSRRFSAYVLKIKDDTFKIFYESFLKSCKA